MLAFSAAPPLDRSIGMRASAKIDVSSLSIPSLFFSFFGGKVPYAYAAANNKGRRRSRAKEPTDSLVFSFSYGREKRREEKRASLLFSSSLGFTASRARPAELDSFKPVDLSETRRDLSRAQRISDPGIGAEKKSRLFRELFFFQETRPKEKTPLSLSFPRTKLPLDFLTGCALRRRVTSTGSGLEGRFARER